MAVPESKLRTCVVGCKRGLRVGSQVQGLPEYEFVGACDLIEERAREAAEGLGGLSVWTDMEEMLDAEQPDVVFIGTNTPPRAELTITAARAGVRGIIAEKPMAMSMGEARAMVEACESNGSRLIVTHQRRMSSEMLEMRSLIDEGAIGEVYLVRASCAGDLLSDGTHAFDSVRWLVADRPAVWVLGQAFRRLPPEEGEPDPEFKGHTGFRYGHAVESGAVSIIQFESGVRGELFTGRARLAGRAYQDYEVFGTEGRLWRPGDGETPLMASAPGGEWSEISIRPENQRDSAWVDVWREFARCLRDGGEHPLDGRNAMRDQELIMATLESARLSERIELPLEQDEYPLDLMIEEGRL
ncbi:MAG: Gfo/Idh/MocA family oxidoreductase [Candidatus Brocadiia bacterium]